MARAETLINLVNTVQRGSHSSYLVKTPGGVIYCLFTSPVDNGLYWTRSSDGGFSWNDPTLVKALAGTQSGFSVWYDKWTPGNTGTLIHLAYFEQTGDDVFYRALDTNDNSLGTETTIFAGASSGSVVNTCISITRAIGGNLYCAFDIDGGTETGFYRSVDAGANWTSRTDVNEATSDYYSIFPGFAADTQDIICVYWDRSADEISRKLYDDSGDSWAESSIATSMVDLATSTAAPQFSAVVDDANNKILLAAWSASDAANADLRFWTIDESAITEGTPIVSNGTDDQGVVALGLATDTTTLYAYYVGKSDGSETFVTAVKKYYKTSTDGGANWGSETLLSLGAARGHDYLMTFPVFTGDFGVAFESQTAGLDGLYYSALFPAGEASTGQGWWGG